MRRLRYSISVLSDAAAEAATRRSAATATTTPTTTWRPGRKLRAISKTAKPVITALGTHRDRIHFADHVIVIARQARDIGDDTFVYGLIIGRLTERSRAGHDTLLVELRVAVRTIVKQAHAL